MKIAINATIVDPASSGLGMYALNVTRELARLHSEVVVYTSTPELFHQNGLVIEVVTGNVRAMRGFKGHVSRVLWSQFSLPRRLSACDASVLLSPTPLEGVLRSPIPQVLIIHDLLPLRYPESYKRQTHYFRYIVPILIRHSRRVIAVSNSTKTDLIKYFGVNPDSVIVIPNGVDADRFSPNAARSSPAVGASGAPYLLYVGNLFPHKNLERLLMAFASVSSRIPHDLLIVGSKDPRYYPALQQKAASLGVQHRVKFLGYAFGEDLPGLYRHADWFVLPSLFEGFGMTALEAMACGTPTLLSKTPALEETAGDAAVYFDPASVAEMAEKISTACLERGLRDRVREKALARVRHFSWTRTAREILNVLEVASNSTSKTE